MVAYCFRGKRHSVEESHVVVEECKRIRYRGLRYVPEQSEHALVGVLQVGFFCVHRLKSKVEQIGGRVRDEPVIDVSFRGGVIIKLWGCNVCYYTIEKA